MLSCMCVCMYMLSMLTYVKGMHTSSYASRRAEGFAQRKFNTQPHDVCTALVCLHAHTRARACSHTQERYIHISYAHASWHALSIAQSACQYMRI